MRLTRSEPSALERQVMELLLAGAQPPFPELRTQWSTAWVTRRVEPSDGLFVDLRIAPDAPRVHPPRFDIGDVHLEFEGLEGGGYATFFVDGGGLSSLHVVRSGGAWVPRSRLRSRCYTRMVGSDDDPDGVRFVPIGLERDWAGVRETLEEAESWLKAP
ncbi:MAG: hypothetical protein ACR2HK_12440 [Gemmatimonadales bacterium]